MSIITKVLKQKAVYWAPIEDGNFEYQAAFDDFGNKRQSEPIELDVRWEDIQEEVVNAAGSTVMVSNKVMVSADVKLGGYLMFGTLDDVDDRDNPLGNALTYEIMKFEKIPNIRASEFLRVAYL